MPRLSASRPPEELTLSPKLQLDGSLTINSSSSLQASPRSLLPGLLTGSADKLIPKGPGQVCVCEVGGEMGGQVCVWRGDMREYKVLGVAGGGQWEILEHSFPSYFSADPAWPWKCHISPKVRAAFHVPWRASHQPPVPISCERRPCLLPVSLFPVTLCLVTTDTRTLFLCPLALIT